LANMYSFSHEANVSNFNVFVENLRQYFESGHANSILKDHHFLQKNEKKKTFPHKLLL